jgi:hypothetical protein
LFLSSSGGEEVRIVTKGIYTFSAPELYQTRRKEALGGGRAFLDPGAMLLRYDSPASCLLSPSN